MVGRVPTATGRVRRQLLAFVAVAAATIASVGFAPAAIADPRLEVTPAEGLDPAGEQVTVHGQGYDENKGIYVAWCVIPAAGEKPTPCGGGEDRSGSSGNSVWISSNPPMYGLGLAESYDDGGSFEVSIVVSRWIEGEDGAIDCFEVACAVTTRADHERSSDRSQDAFGVVTFAGQGATEEPTTGTPSPAPASPSPSASSSSSSVAPTPQPSTTVPSPSATESARPTAGEPGAHPTDAGDDPSEVVVASERPSATPSSSDATTDAVTDASSPDGPAETVAVELDEGSRSIWIVLVALALVVVAATSGTTAWRRR